MVISSSYISLSLCIIRQIHTGSFTLTLKDRSFKSIHYSTTSSIKKINKHTCSHCPLLVMIFNQNDV